MTINLELTPHIQLPTEMGDFQAFAVRDGSLEHFVVYRGHFEKSDLRVRIHSSCLTGDVFTSQRCDCYHQLRDSLQLFSDSHGGVIIYLMQEGRGIGLFNKILAYKLQESGFDTCAANRALGLPVDAREYQVAAEILAHFKPQSITLLTNNPEKITQLKRFLTCDIQPKTLQPHFNSHNSNYLQTKKDLLKHEWATTQES